MFLTNIQTYKYFFSIKSKTKPKEINSLAVDCVLEQCLDSHSHFEVIMFNIKEWSQHLAKGLKISKDQVDIFLIRLD